MSNTTLNIQVQTPLATVNYPVKNTSMAWEETRALRNLFQKIEAGSLAANISVTTGSAVPVQASGTLTLVYGSLVSGTSTCVIGATTLTAETSPSGAVQFGIGANLGAACANLAACVNANTTLNAYRYAAVTATGVVTVTTYAARTLGNLVTLTGGTGITHSAATLTGGAGGAMTIPVTYSRGV
jgi:hypothetical protein